MLTWSMLNWAKPNAPSTYSYIIFFNPPDSKMRIEEIYADLGTKIADKFHYHCFDKNDFETKGTSSKCQVRDKSVRVVVKVTLTVEMVEQLMQSEPEIINQNIIFLREDLFDKKNNSWRIGEEHQVLEPYSCTIS